MEKGMNQEKGVTHKLINAWVIGIHIVGENGDNWDEHLLSLNEGGELEVGCYMSGRNTIKHLFKKEKLFSKAVSNAMIGLELECGGGSSGGDGVEVKVRVVA